MKKEEVESVENIRLLQQQQWDLEQRIAGIGDDTRLAFTER